METRIAEFFLVNELKYVNNYNLLNFQIEELSLHGNKNTYLTNWVIIYLFTWSSFNSLTTSIKNRAKLGHQVLKS
jgi:hypothetical protein